MIRENIMEMQKNFALQLQQILENAAPTGAATLGAVVGQLEALREQVPDRIEFTLIRAQIDAAISVGTNVANAQQVAASAAAPVVDNAKTYAEDLLNINKSLIEANSRFVTNLAQTILPGGNKPE